MRFGRVYVDIIKDAIKYINLRGFSDKDTLSKAQVTPAGVDSTPHDEYVALYCETATRGEGAVIGYIQKNFVTKAGEIRIFSETKEGGLKAYVHCDIDGNVLVNGDTDNMVRFSELEKGFNELRDDLNSLITKYNAHIHVTTATVGASSTVGVLSPTVTQEVASTASIAQSKIDNVKTN